MNWVVRRAANQDSPSSLRLEASELLRLSADARHAGVARKLEDLASRYLELARRIEDERLHGVPANIAGAAAKERI